MVKAVYKFYLTGLRVVIKRCSVSISWEGGSNASWHMIPCPLTGSDDSSIESYRNSREEELAIPLIDSIDFRKELSKRPSALSIGRVIKLAAVIPATIQTVTYVWWHGIPVCGGINMLILLWWLPIL